LIVCEDEYPDPSGCPAKANKTGIKDLFVRWTLTAADNGRIREEVRLQTAEECPAPDA
jgi:hypothetical protein